MAQSIHYTWVGFRFVHGNAPGKQQPEAEFRHPSTAMWLVLTVRNECFALLRGNGNRSGGCRVWGPCSLGLPSVDLALPKNEALMQFLRSGKMKVWHSVWFPTQLCQSQSFQNRNSPVTFQQCCTLAGHQILCFPDKSLGGDRTTEFSSIHLQTPEVMVWDTSEPWTKNRSLGKHRPEETKGCIVVLPEMDMRMRQRDSMVEDGVLAVATQAAGSSMVLASHGCNSGP